METSWTKMMAHVKVASQDMRTKGQRIWIGMGVAKEMLVSTVLQHTTRQLTVNYLAGYLQLKALLCDLDVMDCQYLQMVYAMTDDELIDRVLQFQIHAPTVPSRNLLVQILYVVKEDAFWRDHHNIHPNAHRVRPWLASHDHVRRLIDDVHARVRELRHLDQPSLASAMIHDIHQDFQTLFSAIQLHNELETRHIFHALAQHAAHDIGCLDHILFVGGDSYYPDQILQCMSELLCQLHSPAIASDHNDPPTSSAGSSAVIDTTDLDTNSNQMDPSLSSSSLAVASTILPPNVDAMEQYMDVYFRDVRCKMDEEEVAVVARWLTISPDAHQAILSQLPSESKDIVYRTRSSAWTAPPP